MDPHPDRHAATRRTKRWRLPPPLVAVCLSAALASTGLSAAPQPGGRAPGHYPRPVFFDPRDAADQTPPAVVAGFDAVVVSENVHTVWLDQVRAINPDVKLLLFFSGTTVRDTVKDGWDPADTSNVQKLRKVKVVQNNWLLKDVTGHPITTWVSPIFDLWAVNLTPHCPVDPYGDRYSTWAARTIARRFLHSETGLASYPGWSGMMLDEMFNGISWLQGTLGNGAIDADGNGVPDTSDELNEAWRAEMGLYLAGLRAAVGDSFTIALNGDTVVLEDTDGQAFEDCLAGRSWLEDMYGYAFHHGGYLRNLALSRPGSSQFCVFYARYYEGLTTLPREQFARLAAGSSCLGDGYYILESFDGGTFEPFLTAETYRLDLGLPAGGLERTIVSGDTLYSRGFTNAYVQVNPNPYARGGVPARDAVFTFYAAPDSPSVVPGPFDARVSWLVPDVDGNPRVLDAFEVRYAPFPFDESTWSDASVVYVQRPVAGWQAGERIDVDVAGLLPGTWYHVGVRSRFGGRFSSAPTTILTFQTPPDPDTWTPPDGSGPDGDVHWWDGFASEAPGGVVRAVAARENVLYIGGDFTRAGDVEALHVASWDGAAWRALGPGLTGPVEALTVYDGELVAGGDPGSTGSARPVMAWDGETWRALGNDLYGFAHSLVPWQGRLYAGGSFSVSAVSPRSHSLARWDGSQWELLSTGSLLDTAVEPQLALAIHEERLIGEGNGFLDERSVAFVGSWLPGGWDPIGGELVGEIRSLTVHDGELVAAGRFISLGSTAATNVARWDGSAWVNLGSGLTGEVDVVRSLNGVLVAGGTIRAGGDTPLSNLARWDGAFWTSIGTGTDGPVHDLGMLDGRLLVAGEFSFAGGQPSPFVARWDGSLGDTPIDPDPSEEPPSTSPRSLALAVPTPNPFGSTVSVEFALPAPADIHLGVFDVAGRLVLRLVDGAKSAGVHRVMWSGRDERGAIAPPGIYMVRLRAGAHELTEKIVRAR